MIARGRKCRPVDTRMSRMLDLSSEENAKHFMSRWFRDAPMWRSVATSCYDDNIGFPFIVLCGSVSVKGHRGRCRRIRERNCAEGVR